MSGIENHDEFQRRAQLIDSALKSSKSSSPTQPALHRSEVAMLRQFLRNEQNDVMATPGSATDAEAAEYVDGIQFAIDTLETVWRAAVIVADAWAEAGEIA